MDKQGISRAAETLHKIRNRLGVLQTFLEIVEVPADNEKLLRLRQTCRENLEVIKNWLKDLKD
ncbi:MAG: hypothetical protein HY609_02715 [Deltaproteobacteria bacterium]|nr:hypothetical protein [Deltaproteobacteria bacterium]